MAKRKLSRKELVKSPDEFISMTGRLIQWAGDHMKPLLVGVGVFFALVMVLSVYRYYSAQRSEAAAALLSQTLVVYQEALDRENDPVKAFAAAKPDFEELIEGYDGQPAGQRARLLFAHAALSANATEQAISLYRAAVADFDGNPSLLNTAHNGLASAYLQQGNQDAAIAHFETITRSSSNLLKDAAWFHLGYLYRASGATEKSQAAYQRLRTDFPESMYAQIAPQPPAG